MFLEGAVGGAVGMTDEGGMGSHCGDEGFSLPTRKVRDVDGVDLVRI